jgi:chromosome partitioning protein
MSAHAADANFVNAVSRLEGIGYTAIDMRTIALFNQKGGVGKTTTTVNLGAALAAVGKKTILIDMDPQTNLSFHLGLESDKVTHSIYDVLCQDVALADALYPVADRLSVVPATPDLAGAEVELVNLPDRESRLRKMAAAKPLDYDFLLIDCPPSLGLLTINALCMVTEVIIPLQAHFLALQGMARLLETCSMVRERLNAALRISAILFCQYESAPRLTGEVTEEVEKFLDSSRDSNQPWSTAVVLETHIRRNIKLAEAPSFNKSIFDYAPNCAGAADYQVLAEEIMQMKMPH